MTSKARWSEKPDTADFPKAIEALAFEAYHMGLFLELCKRGVTERRRGEGYQRSLYDHTFEYSLYVHLRAVFYFFYPGRNKNPDDLLWEDFVTKQPFTPPDLPGGDTLRVNLNKRVAHLTEYRFVKPQPTSSDEPKDGVQYYVEHGEEVNNVLRSFVECLNSDLKEAFRRKVSALEDRERKLLQPGPARHFLQP